MSYGQYISVSATTEKALMKRDEIKLFGEYMMDEIKILLSMANMVTQEPTSNNSSTQFTQI